MARLGPGIVGLVLLLMAAPAAQAAFHMFRIQQIFSNADGSVQFVVLRECCGIDGENRFGGVTLKATNGSGTRTFTFPRNLPTPDTATRSVLVATQGFADLGLIEPDYVMPSGFVPVEGGTLNYGGVSQLTFGPLPTDGRMLLAGGSTAPNLAINFAGLTASVGATTPSALAVEFYNAGLDHYFLSHIAAEIGDLDKGVHPGWARTGQSFRVFTQGAAQNSPVCRFYIPPAKGDSHFYGRGTQECAETGTKNPTFVNEDPQFFFVALPTAGVCPSGTIKVYRAFDNRADANHRYMIDAALRDVMESQRHWVIEGDGPDRVVMCVPPTLAAPPETPPTEPPDPYTGGGY